MDASMFQVLIYPYLTPKGVGKWTFKELVTMGFDPRDIHAFNKRERGFLALMREKMGKDTPLVLWYWLHEHYDVHDPVYMRAYRESISTIVPNDVK
jgi:hypothetical protein